MHEPALKKKPEPRNEPPAVARRSERPKAPPVHTPGLHTAGPAAVPFPTSIEAQESEPASEDLKPEIAGKPAEKPAAEKEAAPKAAKEDEAAPKEVVEGSDAGGAKRLAKVLGKVDKTARRQKGPAARTSRAKKAAGKAAADASAAAPSPAEEPLAKGKASQIGEMNDPKKKGAVEKEDFLALVKKKLRQMEMPSNPSQMAKFKKQGGASGLKSELVGGVEAQKQKSMGGLQAAAGAEPRPAEKRVTADEPAMDPGPGAPRLDAQDVLPPPKTDAEISLDGDRDEMEATLRNEELSAGRLRKASDPRFDAVQDGREEVHAQAAAGPAVYRAEEGAYLAEQKTAAVTDEKAGRGAMRATRRRAGAKVHGAQHTQMSAEEAQRKKFVTDVDAIYAKTQKTVDDKLLWLNGEVDRRFTDGEAEARGEFEDFVDREFRAWKSRRYSGARGKLRWIGDRFRDINNLSGAKQVYVDGQDLYYKKLDETIEDIGTLIDTTLTWCLEETRKGDEKVREHFENLDDGVKTLVSDAFAEVLDRFGDLKSRVEDHREELADKLVQRYQESREKLDARIEEIKQSHRSLYVRVKRKIVAVIEAIRNFKNRLMAILSRAANVISMILDDPIDFLANLLRAVKVGFHQFSANIWEHLKQGVFGWLFGTLSGIGIQVPNDFSAKSIFGLILQVAGITYDNVRERAVKIVGARNVAAIERVGGYLSTLFSEGPAGLWVELQEDLGDLKDTVLDSVKEWVVTRIVTAAVTKLVSMFNPVGAIVQAVLTIYNVVRFFIERIDQILALVNSIIDSLAMIVRGNVKAAAAFIERSLALTIPLIISFLARLLGLGGVAERVKKIIHRVRRRINRAIDKMLRRIARAVTGAARKVKAGAKKLLEWWKMRRKFKQGGKSHSLFFEGSGTNVGLMVASKKQTLETYIDDRMASATKEDKKVLKRIRGLAKKIDDEKKTIRNGEVKRTHIGENRGRRIRDLFLKIVVQLGKLKGFTDVRPRTDVKWTTVTHNIGGGNTSTDAVSMTAKPLSLDPGQLAGSEPKVSERSNLFKQVNQRKDTYVLGHLLNHHLHGPGEMRNLTPMRGTDNTTMESTYESKVKKAVLEENKLVSYSVQVEYEGHGQRKFIPEESHLATGLHLKAYEMKLKTDTEDKDLVKDPANWRNGKKIFNEKMPLTVPKPDKKADAPPELVKRVSLIDRATNKKYRELVISHVAQVEGIGKERAALLLDANKRYKKDAETLKEKIADQRGVFVTDEMISDMKAKKIYLTGETKIKVT